MQQDIHGCMGFTSLDALWVALCVTLYLALGCEAKVGKGPEDPTRILTVQEAQTIVREERRRLGVDEAASPEPTSMNEVIQILTRDESERFPQAQQYLSRLEGVDALALRATLEMLWADGQLTLAALAREQAKQKEAEVAAASEMQKLEPNDAELTRRKERAKSAAEREQRLRDALETLARPHQDTAMSLALEVVRRNPERADGYAVLANVYRLQGDWPNFELNMRKAEPHAADRASVQYARALEREARMGDREGARAALQALIAEYPDMARAQARLVLLEDDIEARFAQLQRLRGINPRHALVLLEGKAIQTEYETALAVRSAAESPGERMHDASAPIAPAEPGRAP